MKIKLKLLSTALILIIFTLTATSQTVDVINLNKQNWTEISKSQTYNLYSKIENCPNKKLTDWDYFVFKIKNNTGTELNIDFSVDFFFEDGNVKSKMFSVKIPANSIYTSNCKKDKDKNFMYPLYQRDYVANTKNKIIRFKISKL
jgi:hypothetical protein